MPITVVIRSVSTAKESAAPSLTFDGTRVVIGRGLGCEVRLPDPSVSQRHATVRADGPDYTLVDEGSTNGTFVGEARLVPRAPRTLRNGDVVRVGRVWLEVKIDQTPATHDLPTATRDLALKLVADAMRALGDDVSSRVSVVEGPDRGRAAALAEEGRVYVVGRGEACDLLLDDDDVSREHVQLVRRAGGVLVRDLGSKNGAWLGETRIAPDRDNGLASADDASHGQDGRGSRRARGAGSRRARGCAGRRPARRGRPPPPPRSSVPAPGPMPGARRLQPLRWSHRPAPSLPSRGARARGGWSGADVAVVVAALCIMALSAAGLYWLLRG